MSGDVMRFPYSWEQFLRDYEFEDSRRIYTNGARLIPSFRVKQMMEHYTSMEYGQWDIKKTPLGKEYTVCTNCNTDFQYKLNNGEFERLDLRGVAYCPKCGVKIV